eukprot:TRINITY_DN12276_c1_g2_i4.p3 TRINITY_DN12276_c1_g2~~TRINITY_DN12276_c1_g2_i4.p3  ORF type:complete len:107 (-),score=17.57 TRINITY_DN12276_c1_g2_i4:14-334(-)
MTPRESSVGPSLLCVVVATAAVRALGIARWDGTQWSDLDGGTFFSGPNALSSFDDGSGPALYAAGDFFEAGGEPAEKIARWTRKKQRKRQRQEAKRIRKEGVKKRG